MFKLLNTNRFYLPGTKNQALHLASLSYGVREFMCFYLEGKIYIEEVTGGGGPFFIKDDELAQALSDFLTLKGVLDSRKPLLPDAWHKAGKPS